MKFPIIQWYRETGTAVQHENLTVTPESQVLKIELPFGGFVWQRPTAVIVNEEHGGVRKLPIADVVRTAVFAIWGFAALLVVVSWLKRHLS